MSMSEHLAQLESAQLVRRLSDPEVAYMFRNALAQETTYSSVLLRHRRELHLQVARALEMLYGDRLEELAPLLAHHYAVAGADPSATLRYARIAGDTASRRYANTEAIQHYGIALKAAQAVPAVESETLLHLYTSRGRAYELSGDYDQALANYAELSALADRRGDSRLELAALMAVATIRSTPNSAFDAIVAQTLCNQALTLAQEIGDRAAEAKILWILLLLNFFAANPAQSVAFGERAIALARELGLREQLAFALNDIHRSYMALGRVVDALAVLEEAEGLWRDMDNLPMLADNLNGGAEVRLSVGDFDGTLARTAESEAITEAIGNLWQLSYGRMIRTVVYLERGEVDQGIAEAEAAMRLAESAGFVIPLVYLRVQLAQTYAELGAFDRATEVIDQALTTIDTVFLAGRPFALAAAVLVLIQKDDLAAADAAFREAQSRPHFDASLVAAVAFGAPTFWLAEGELRLRQGAYTAALSVADELLTGLRTFQMRPYLPDALHLKARALASLGQLEEGRRILEEARVEARRLGSRRALWHILASLAELADPDEAEVLRHEARDIVQVIANHITSEQLRAEFLNTTKTRALFTAAGNRPYTSPGAAH
jgi:tetratricopeptide (TPR) repeat protein